MNENSNIVVNSKIVQAETLLVTDATVGTLVVADLTVVGTIVVDGLVVQTLTVTEQITGTLTEESSISSTVTTGANPAFQLSGSQTNTGVGLGLSGTSVSNSGVDVLGTSTSGRAISMVGTSTSNRAISQFGSTASATQPAIRSEGVSSAAGDGYELFGTSSTGTGTQITGDTGTGGIFGISLTGSSDGDDGINVSGTSTTGGNGLSLSGTSSATASIGVDVSGTSASNSPAIQHTSNNTSTGEGHLINATAISDTALDIIAVSTSGRAVEVDATSTSQRAMNWTATSNTLDYCVRMDATNTNAGGGGKLQIINSGSNGYFLSSTTTSATGEPINLFATSNGAADGIVLTSNTGDGIGTLVTTTAGSGRAFDVDATSSTNNALRLQGTTAATDSRAVVIDGSLSNGTTDRAPVFLSGTSSGSSLCGVLGQDFGWSYATVFPGDANYTLDVENMNGTIIYYTTSLTANRTVTLPDSMPSNYSGTPHIYVVRRAGGGNNLTIDAQSANIRGLHMTSGGQGDINSSTIATGNTYASVHLFHHSSGTYDVDVVSAYFS